MASMVASPPGAPAPGGASHATLLPSCGEKRSDSPLWLPDCENVQGRRRVAGGGV